MKLIFLIFFLTEKSQPWWNSIFQLFLQEFLPIFIFGTFGLFFWAHLSVLIFGVKIVLNIFILLRFHCFQKKVEFGERFFVPALILLVENQQGEYLINVSHILPFSRLKIFPLLLAADTLPCNGFSTSKSGGLWHLSCPRKGIEFQSSFSNKETTSIMPSKSFIQNNNCQFNGQVWDQNGVLLWIGHYRVTHCLTHLSVEQGELLCYLFDSLSLFSSKQQIVPYSRAG